MRGKVSGRRVVEKPTTPSRRKKSRKNMILTVMKARGFHEDSDVHMLNTVNTSIASHVDCDNTESTIVR